MQLVFTDFRFSKLRRKRWRLLSLELGVWVVLTLNSATLLAEKHAVLVGVSHYPMLDETFALLGADNDVRLMRQLLTDKFQFPSDRIQTLSEEAGRSYLAQLPTRGNIVEAISRLAEMASDGDQVVIFLAGHGARQPESGEGEPEVDGLDEIFLPSDVGRWEPDRGRVPNAIVDDEIAKWMKAILAKGAQVWLIFDCCHAGDMSRGIRERTRSVDPTEKNGLAIPPEVMQKARTNARERRAGERTRGMDDDALPLEGVEAKGLVITYACQSHEKAVELPLGPDKKHYGLLSYALNAVLSQSSRPISYRDLSRKTYRNYVALGLSDGPTPLVEGDVDRAVLGREHFEPAPIYVSIDLDNNQSLRIDAGELRGISANSILAVFPATGDQGSPIGHLRVTEVGVATAAVEPCEFSGVPRQDPKLLDGGRCELVEVDYGDLKIRISADPTDAAGTLLSKDRFDQLNGLVADLASRKQSMATAVQKVQSAQWLLRWNDDLIEINSATFSPGNREAGKKEKLFGPYASDDEGRETLANALNQIARAENLLRIAGMGKSDLTAESGGLRIRVDAKLRRRDGFEDVSQSSRVIAGDRLELRVENAGDADLDLSVLYVNSRMGIAPVFPGESEINRIRPGQSRLVEGKFTAGPLGRGHFVIVALEAEGQPRDFAWLAQKSLPATRSKASQLDALFEYAMFREGKTRSASSNPRCIFDIFPIDIGE
jgi:hypothetical protein